MALAEYSRTVRWVFPLNPGYMLWPLLLLALPLKLPNSLTQPLAMLALAPLLVVATRHAVRHTLIWILLFGTVLTSFAQVFWNPDLESSAYQAARSGLPFVIVCLLMTSYREILVATLAIIERNPVHYRKAIDAFIFLFACFCALQTLSFLFGFSLANALSMSEDNRVMIFQSTSCVALVFYAIISKKYLVLFLLSIVVVGSASKAIFAATALVALLALVTKFDLGTFVRLVLASAIFTGALFYVNPLVIERLSTFIHNEDGEAFHDATRELEIEHARNTLLRNDATTLFGMGFAAQVSPGVLTFDPAWAENSKYDIENGYWGVLAKLGIVFTALFLLNGLTNVPLSGTTLCVAAIEFVMFFKTSYQIFCYMDGVYLLVWSIIISAQLSSDQSGRRSHV